LLASRKLKVNEVNTDDHLFAEALEQMKDLLRSPALESRAKDPFVTKTIIEFYSLIDAYAENQSLELDDPKHSEQLRSIFTNLASKIDAIEDHVNSGLDKLNFLSEVKPKN
jgi:hypothetical protein